MVDETSPESSESVPTSPIHSTSTAINPFAGWTHEKWLPIEIIPLILDSLDIDDVIRWLVTGKENSGIYKLLGSSPSLNTLTKEQLEALTSNNEYTARLLVEALTRIPKQGRLNRLLSVLDDESVSRFGLTRIIDTLIASVTLDLKQAHTITTNVAQLTISLIEPTVRKEILQVLQIIIETRDLPSKLATAKYELALAEGELNSAFSANNSKQGVNKITISAQIVEEVSKREEIESVLALEKAFNENESEESEEELDELEILSQKVDSSLFEMHEELGKTKENFEKHLAKIEDLKKTIEEEETYEKKELINASEEVLATVSSLVQFHKEELADALNIKEKLSGILTTIATLETTLSNTSNLTTKLSVIAEIRKNLQPANELLDQSSYTKKSLDSLPSKIKKFKLILLVKNRIETKLNEIHVAAQKAGATVFNKVAIETLKAMDNLDAETNETLKSNGITRLVEYATQVLFNDRFLARAIEFKGTIFLSKAAAAQKFSRSCERTIKEDIQALQIKIDQDNGSHPDFQNWQSEKEFLQKFLDKKDVLHAFFQSCQAAFQAALPDAIQTYIKAKGEKVKFLTSNNLKLITNIKVSEDENTELEEFSIDIDPELVTTVWRWKQAEADSNQLTNELSKAASNLDRAIHRAAQRVQLVAQCAQLITQGDEVVLEAIPGRNIAMISNIVQVAEKVTHLLVTNKDSESTEENNATFSAALNSLTSEIIDQQQREAFKQKRSVVYRSAHLAIQQALHEIQKNQTEEKTIDFLVANSIEKAALAPLSGSPSPELPRVSKEIVEAAFKTLVYAASERKFRSAFNLRKPDFIADDVQARELVVEEIPPLELTLDGNERSLLFQTLLFNGNFKIARTILAQCEAATLSKSATATTIVPLYGLPLLDILVMVLKSPNINEQQFLSIVNRYKDFAASDRLNILTTALDSHRFTDSHVDMMLNQLSHLSYLHNDPKLADAWHQFIFKLEEKQLVINKSQLRLILRATRRMPIALWENTFRFIARQSQHDISMLREIIDFAPFLDPGDLKDTILSVGLSSKADESIFNKLFGLLKYLNENQRTNILGQLVEDSQAAFNVIFNSALSDQKPFGLEKALVLSTVTTSPHLTNAQRLLVIQQVPELPLNSWPNILNACLNTNFAIDEEVGKAMLPYLDVLSSPNSSSLLAFALAVNPGTVGDQFNLVIKHLNNQDTPESTTALIDIHCRIAQDNEGGIDRMLSFLKDHNYDFNDNEWPLILKAITDGKDITEQYLNKLLDGLKENLKDGLPLYILEILIESRVATEQFVNRILNAYRDGLETSDQLSLMTTVLGRSAHTREHAEIAFQLLDQSKDELGKGALWRDLLIAISLSTKLDDHQRSKILKDYLVTLDKIYWRQVFVAAALYNPTLDIHNIIFDYLPYLQENERSIVLEAIVKKSTNEEHIFNILKTHLLDLPTQDRPGLLTTAARRDIALPEIHHIVLGYLPDLPKSKWFRILVAIAERATNPEIIRDVYRYTNHLYNQNSKHPLNNHEKNNLKEILLAIAENSNHKLLGHIDTFLKLIPVGNWQDILLARVDNDKVSSSLLDKTLDYLPNIKPSHRRKLLAAVAKKADITQLTRALSFIDGLPQGDDRHAVFDALLSRLKQINDSANPIDSGNLKIFLLAAANNRGLGENHLMILLEQTKKLAASHDRREVLIDLLSSERLDITAYLDDIKPLRENFSLAPHDWIGALSSFSHNERIKKLIPLDTCSDFFKHRLNELNDNDAAACLLEFSKAFGLHQTEWKMIFKQLDLLPHIHWKNILLALANNENITNNPLERKAILQTVDKQFDILVQKLALDQFTSSERKNILRPIAKYADEELLNNVISKLHRVLPDSEDRQDVLGVILQSEMLSKYLQDKAFERFKVLEPKHKLEVLLAAIDKDDVNNDWLVSCIDRINELPESDKITLLNAIVKKASEPFINAKLRTQFENLTPRDQLSFIDALADNTQVSGQLFIELSVTIKEARSEQLAPIYGKFFFNNPQRLDEIYQQRENLSPNTKKGFKDESIKKAILLSVLSSPKSTSQDKVTASGLADTLSSHMDRNELAKEFIDHINPAAPSDELRDNLVLAAQTTAATEQALLFILAYANKLPDIPSQRAVIDELLKRLTDLPHVGTRIATAIAEHPACRRAQCIKLLEYLDSDQVTQLLQTPSGLPTSGDENSIRRGFSSILKNKDAPFDIVLDRLQETATTQLGNGNETTIFNLNFSHTLTEFVRHCPAIYYADAMQMLPDNPIAQDSFLDAALNNTKITGDDFISLLNDISANSLGDDLDQFQKALQQPHAPLEIILQYVHTNQDAFNVYKHDSLVFIFGNQQITEHQIEACLKSTDDPEEKQELTALAVKRAESLSNTSRRRNLILSILRYGDWEDPTHGPKDIVFTHLNSKALPELADRKIVFEEMLRFYSSCLDDFTTLEDKAVFRKQNSQFFLDMLKHTILSLHRNEQKDFFLALAKSPLAANDLLKEMIKPDQENDSSTTRWYIVDEAISKLLSEDLSNDEKGDLLEMFSQSKSIASSQLIRVIQYYDHFPPSAATNALFYNFIERLFENKRFDTNQHFAAALLLIARSEHTDITNLGFLINKAMQESDIRDKHLKEIFDIVIGKVFNRDNHSFLQGTVLNIFSTIINSGKAHSTQLHQIAEYANKYMAPNYAKDIFTAILNQYEKLDKSVLFEIASIDYILDDESVTKITDSANRLEPDDHNYAKAIFDFIIKKFSATFSSRNTAVKVFNTILTSDHKSVGNVISVVQYIDGLTSHGSDDPRHKNNVTNTFFDQIDTLGKKSHRREALFAFAGIEAASSPDAMAKLFGFAYSMSDIKSDPDERRAYLNSVIDRRVNKKAGQYDSCWKRLVQNYDLSTLQMDAIASSSSAHVHLSFQFIIEKLEKDDLVEDLSVSKKDVLLTILRHKNCSPQNHLQIANSTYATSEILDQIIQRLDSFKDDEQSQIIDTIVDNPHATSRHFAEVAKKSSCTQEAFDQMIEKINLADFLEDDKVTKADVAMEICRNKESTPKHVTDIVKGNESGTSEVLDRAIDRATSFAPKDRQELLDAVIESPQASTTHFASMMDKGLANATLLTKMLDRLDSERPISKPLISQHSILDRITDATLDLSQEDQRIALGVLFDKSLVHTNRLTRIIDSEKTSAPVLLNILKCIESEFHPHEEYDTDTVLTRIVDKAYSLDTDDASKVCSYIIDNINALKANKETLLPKIIDNTKASAKHYALITEGGIKSEDVFDKMLQQILSADFAEDHSKSSADLIDQMIKDAHILQKDRRDAAFKEIINSDLVGNRHLAPIADLEPPSVEVLKTIVVRLHDIDRRIRPLGSVTRREVLDHVISQAHKLKVDNDKTELYRLIAGNVVATDKHKNDVIERINIDHFDDEQKQVIFSGITEFNVRAQHRTLFGNAPLRIENKIHEDRMPPRDTLGFCMGGKDSTSINISQFATHHIEEADDGTKTHVYTIQAERQAITAKMWNQFKLDIDAYQNCVNARQTPIHTSNNQSPPRLPGPRTHSKPIPLKADGPQQPGQSSGLTRLFGR